MGAELGRRRAEARGHLPLAAAVRLLHLTPELPFAPGGTGGATRQFELLRGLVRRGHEVAVVAPVASGQPACAPARRRRAALRLRAAALTGRWRPSTPSHPPSPRAPSVIPWWPGRWRSSGARCARSRRRRSPTAPDVRPRRARLGRRLAPRPAGPAARAHAPEPLVALLRAPVRAPPPARAPRRCGSKHAASRASTAGSCGRTTSCSPCRTRTASTPRASPAAASRRCPTASTRARSARSASPTARRRCSTPARSTTPPTPRGCAGCCARCGRG